LWLLAGNKIAGGTIVDMRERGKPAAANWLALAIGLLLLATVVAGGLRVMRKSKPSVPKVTMGTNDQVYYSRPVTMDEATRLGRALQDTGYFGNRGTTVQLSRNKGVTVVSFVVGAGAWDRATTVESFEEIGRRVATSVGGFPIEVHLVDTAWTIHKSMEVGKAIIGSKDAIYYFGSATESDARALGQALRDAGYLGNLGVSVVVWKGHGAAIGFVVGEGVWDRPDAVAGFERLAKRVAPSAGGPPVELRLLNAEMEIKTQATLR
jgi:hypothetical protein